MLDGCGHVPQVERAERTAELLEDLFERASAAGPLPVSGARKAA